MKRFFLILYILLLSGNSYGEECSHIVARFFENNSPTPVALVQGMRVELQEEGKAPVKAVYLGSLVTLGGKKDKIGFFEEGDPGVLHYISNDRLNFENAGEDHYIVKSVNQVGPTCAAYSMFNCLREMNLKTNFKNEAIEKSLSDEESRSSLLVSIINDYYTDFTNDTDKITKIFAPFNYQTYSVPKNNNFKSETEKYLKSGYPVLLTFDVPPEMSVMGYSIISHDATQENAIAIGRNLWQPKNKDQPRHGGHMVFAQGIFEVNGKKKILILDPNYQIPRLWDLDTLNNYVGGNISAHVIFKKE